MDTVYVFMVGVIMGIMLMAWATDRYYTPKRKG